MSSHETLSSGDAVVAESPNLICDEDSEKKENRKNMPTAPISEKTSSEPKNPNKRGTKSSSLPALAVEYLKAWMMSPEHVHHPYPTDREKVEIMEATGIELKQLTNWFVNNRKRYWKPRVETARSLQRARATMVACSSLNTMVLDMSMDIATARSHQIEAANKSFLLTPNMVENAPPAVILPRPRIPFPCKTPQSPEIPQKSSVSSTEMSVGDDSGSHFVTPAPWCNTSSLPNLISSSDDESSTCSSRDAAPFSNLLGLNFARRNSALLGPVSPCSSVGQGHTDDYDKTGKFVTRTEVVSVHILKGPNHGREPPTIKDVTILSKGDDHIVKSYLDCNISYSFPKELLGDRKKLQRMRDGEVVRIKKHYLRLFLSDWRQSLCEAVAPTNDKKYDDNEEKTLSSLLLLKRKPRSQSEPLSITPSTHKTLDIAADPSDRPRKVKRRCSYDDKDMNKKTNPLSKRHKKARYNNLLGNRENWREKCRNARTPNDKSLPSLEEAAIMFGFKMAALQAVE